MSALVEYTLEVYKADKRTKEGKRLVVKEDFAPSTKDYITTVADKKRKLGFIVNIFETYVTRKNAMTGQEFQERYDTPWSCSAASESYFSN